MKELKNIRAVERDNAHFSILSSVLTSGGVVVAPTDTIYGILGSALLQKTVSRIYRLRKRNPKKPMIVLIADPNDVRRFGVTPDRRTISILRRVWPGKVSVILRAVRDLKKFSYLHRGTKTLAFRVPKPKWLRKLLLETGPLVAPSANIEGKPPARTIREAKKYFGKKVDLYKDGGRIEAKPSTLIEIKKGRLAVLRHAGRRPPLCGAGTSARSELN